MSFLIIIKHTPIVTDYMFCFFTMDTLCILVIQMKYDHMKVTRVRESSVLIFTANKCSRIKYNVLHDLDTVCSSLVFNNSRSAFYVSADTNFRTSRLDEKSWMRYNSCDIPVTRIKYASMIQFTQHTSEYPPMT